jgi:hypothetical protein
LLGELEPDEPLEEVSLEEPVLPEVSLEEPLPVDEGLSLEVEPLPVELVSLDEEPVEPPVAVSLELPVEELPVEELLPIPLEEEPADPEVITSILLTCSVSPEPEKLART